MMREEYDLKFNREDFQKIYFRNNTGSVLFGPTTKKSFFAFVLMLLVTIGLSFYAVPNEQDAIFFISWAILGLIAMNFAKKSGAVIRWRKSIQLFFKEEENFNSMKLVLSDEGIAIHRDDKVVFEDWNDIQKSEITDDFIWIEGKVHTVIPKGSLQNGDFEKVKKIVEGFLN
ncbi:MAG: hypothetical protein KAG26_08505 [Methylococcales bacterium]|nr:hypothetical protein [Methylococcales bacterium]